MWIIAVGNAFDGIDLYTGMDGLPFDSHDEALKEAEKLFASTGEEWNIVLLCSVADIAEAEEIEDDE